MHKLICILTLSLVCFYSSAQKEEAPSGFFDDSYWQKRKGKGNKRSDHFSKNRLDAIWSHSNSHYRPFGWHIDPGLTYMIGNSANDGDDYNLTPSGLPGYHLEVGLEHLFKKARKVFHYVDYGIGIKHFGGVEKYKSDDGLVDRGTFNFGNVFARGGIHNVWQLNLYNFIDQSIGANIDYRIYGGKDKQSEGSYESPLASQNENKLVVNLHYSIGWGIKIRDGFFIIPTLQMPIMKFVSWNGFNPSHSWFQSRYEPAIFSIRLGWLFPKKGCPPVYDNGKGKQQSDQYQMR